MKYNYWHSMPRFVQNKKTEFKKVVCEIQNSSETLFLRFDTEKDYQLFCMRAPISKNNGKSFVFSDREHIAKVTKQKITAKTKSIWFPFKSHWGGVGTKKYYSDKITSTRYPVYIVSKGRWDNGLTTKALHEMSLDHYIVVERSEYSKYKEVANINAKIIILPEKYLANYDTCDNLGDEKSKGPGAARNFCHDHSQNSGFSRHWVMDDNLDAFHYLTDNKKLEVRTPATLAATENFVDRYANVPVAGLNYYSFCKSGDAVPPVVFNTRIYSCLLIENGTGYKWRGRYNEDTDLSLRVLKDGLCTIQMNAFLCGKVTTQRMRGGNSKEFYDAEGTKPKSQMLEDLHPDVAKVVWRFGRWHHHVNYRPFKSNQPKLKDDYLVVDDYGLELK